MTVGERLWEKAKRLREVWEGVARAEDDLLRRFKDPVEFIDWFKASADPVLQFHYEIGYQWGLHRRGGRQVLAQAGCLERVGRRVRRGADSQRV
jgi:hypothetical protein